MIANLITALGLLTAATFGAPATTSRVDVSRLQGIIFPTIGSPFAPSDAASSDDMHYNMGNPVLTGDVNIYHIYYGNWTESQKSILEHFNNNIGYSKWYNINRKYYFQKDAKSNKVYANGKVGVKGTVADNYSKGNTLSGNALPEIIQSHIDAGRLPEDTSAVYFVLTSGDVKETIRSDLGYASFCSEYCGYHVSWKLKSGKRIFYSMVGNPTACLDGCGYYSNDVKSPNGDVGVDAMTSVVAHELVEAVSDPESDGNRAWEDGTGYENADKCAWGYGKTTRDKSGFTYNLEMSGKKYLIQQNWDVVSQSCKSEL